MTVAEAPKGPSDLPKRSWWETLKRTFSEFRDDNLTDWGAALTYYAVLSLFPALIALISIVGLVADPVKTTNTLTSVVQSLGPKTASDTFAGPIRSLTANKQAAGLALVFGLATAVWTASGYVGAFIRASNSIYEVEEGRPFWKLRPLQLLVTLVMVLLMAMVAVAIVATGPVAEAVGNAVGAGSAAVTLWNIAKWPVLLAVVITMFSLLYYASPNVKLPSYRWITWGSVVAILLWIVASLLFALYVANFSNYNKTYGTLGGVVTFLVWLWITNLAVLLGAELNAELERSRELQTGEPAERELQLPPRDPPKDKGEPPGAEEQAKTA